MNIKKTSKPGKPAVRSSKLVVDAGQEPSVERKWWVVERQVNAGDKEDWRAPWHCEYAVGSWVGIVIQKSLVSARNSERWAARIYKGHAVRVVEVFERRTTKLRKSGASSPNDPSSATREEI